MNLGTALFGVLLLGVIAATAGMIIPSANLVGVSALVILVSGIASINYSTGANVN